MDAQGSTMLRLMAAACLAACAGAAQHGYASSGSAIAVPLGSKNSGECGNAVVHYLWIPRTVLPLLGMPNTTCTSDCGMVTLNGAPYNLGQINVADGSDVCNVCGCPLAYLQLVSTIYPPGSPRCGDKVNMTYTPKNGPPAPPHPPVSPTPPPPLPPGPNFNVSGLYLELSTGSLTAQLLNKSVPDGSVWNKTNNFSFVGGVPGGEQRTGCYALGDITLRVAPTAAFPTKRGSGNTPWAFYSSAYGGPADWRGIIPVHSTDPNVLAAHDITAVVNGSQFAGTYNNSLFDGSVPLKVVRSWEKSIDGGGLILRFNLTNTWGEDITLGGLGFAMPQAGMQNRIEESVWNDPHIGGDHGFVEWVRVVVDEQTMLATAEGVGTPMEGWRPIMEGCSNDAWEWSVHTEAWASEWMNNAQYPFLKMADFLVQAKSKIDNSTLWPMPHASPWPAWKKGETVPLTDFKGIAAPWNTPTSIQLSKGESKSYAIRLTLAEQGPRTRNDALLKARKAVLYAAPGYVISPDMQSVSLTVKCPAGLTLDAIHSQSPDILSARIMSDNEHAVKKDSNLETIKVMGLKSGRATLTLSFSDKSTNQVHYNVLPPLKSQIDLVGRHWAEDAWLPLEYPDPFGRAAAVMPWDRHDRTHVLDDSRGYDVGISDDAGGGNPLGFAIKTAYAPNQFHVTRLDDYVKWTLYGIKTPENCPKCGAKAPFKSLQIRPEDCIPALGNQNGSQCGAEDAIRMTMYYYCDSGTCGEFNNSHGGWSGHWYYNYSGAWGIGAPGIEGGPNWPMSEGMANATYRVFNFPHHVTTYLSLYYAARFTTLATYKPWDWYLMRAANTTLKFGAPSVGVMDDTTFREILNALNEEASADPSRTDFKESAENITRNMLQRAGGFAAKPYPYGSEFAFDTTGQEAVVVWLMYFANETNGFGAAAKKTVDHVLSYMRSSGTWAYNGGSRSWGDLGNNGKWQVTSGTNFQTRGNFHYRSGLNSIPLLEWYRKNPDDFFLLEPSIGAVSGQMGNIDEHGAPGMMMHMEPHILDYDAHSGDYGLGFFGCSLQSASYFVMHPEAGALCYLCDMEMSNTDSNSTADMPSVLRPRDLYHKRFFLEPLALYLTLDVGTFDNLTISWAKKEMTVAFAPMSMDNCTYAKRRLRLTKTSTDRPGSEFTVPGETITRNAYEIDAGKMQISVSWH